MLLNGLSTLILKSTMLCLRLHVFRGITTNFSMMQPFLSLIPITVHQWYLIYRNVKLGCCDQIQGLQGIEYDNGQQDIIHMYLFLFKLI